jgi:hypothetical protein
LIVKFDAPLNKNLIHQTLSVSVTNSAGGTSDPVVVTNPISGKPCKEDPEEPFGATQIGEDGTKKCLNGLSASSLDHVGSGNALDPTSAKLTAFTGGTTSGDYTNHRNAGFCALTCSEANTNKYFMCEDGVWDAPSCEQVTVNADTADVDLGTKKLTITGTNFHPKENAVVITSDGTGTPPVVESVSTGGSTTTAIITLGPLNSNLIDEKLLVKVITLNGGASEAVVVTETIKRRIYGVSSGPFHWTPGVSRTNTRPVYISFSTLADLPHDGKVGITFPDGFVYNSGATPTSTIDGAFTVDSQVVGDGVKVTLARTANTGSSFSPGAANITFPAGALTAPEGEEGLLFGAQPGLVVETLTGSTPIDSASVPALGPNLVDCASTHIHWSVDTCSSCDAIECSVGSCNDGYGTFTAGSSPFCTGLGEIELSAGDYDPQVLEVELSVGSSDELPVTCYAFAGSLILVEDADLATATDADGTSRSPMTQTNLASSLHAEFSFTGASTPPGPATVYCESDSTGTRARMERAGPSVQITYATTGFEAHMSIAVDSTVRCAYVTADDTPPDADSITNDPAAVDGVTSLAEPDATMVFLGETLE